MISLANTDDFIAPCIVKKSTEQDKMSLPLCCFVKQTSVRKYDRGRHIGGRRLMMEEIALGT